jgi:hypothetical protein
MTPERLAALVVRWAGWYTRGLPGPVAQRRRDEIRADLCDHLGHGRAGGLSEARLGGEVLSRLLRGLLADTTWRRDQVARHATTKGGTPVRRTLSRPVVRVALGIAVVLALPAIATPTGAADWSPADFLLAAALLAVVGTTLELAVRRAGSVLGAAAVAALGVAAAFAGDADDAPGLTLIGVLLVAGSGLLLVRVVRRAR